MELNENEKIEIKGIKIKKKINIRLFGNIPIGVKIVLSFILMAILIDIASFTDNIPVLICGQVFAIVVGLILAKDIHKQLSIICKLTERMSKFNLTSKYSNTRKDEFGKTSRDL